MKAFELLEKSISQKVADEVIRRQKEIQNEALMQFQAEQYAAYYTVQKARKLALAKIQYRYN